MKTQTLVMEDVKIRGMKALARELGAAGMAQFMQQFGKGYGDYSKDRHRILDRFTVDDIFDAIARKKGSR
jgi:hypothetical protein